MHHQYQIITSQLEPHRDIVNIARKHASTTYLKPISPRQKLAFETAMNWLSARQGPVIIDAGCGKAMSSLRLSAIFPQHAILAIDKSSKRLPNVRHSTDKIFFLQASLVDFYLQAATSEFFIDRHYLLYPNPWPKPQQLMRRWHGHPIFPHLLTLAKTTIIRSNWLIYLQEFAAAAQAIANVACTIDKLQPTPPPLTHFEQKYWHAGEDTYELIVESIPSTERAYTNVT